MSVFIMEQPKTPYGKAKAKSKAMFLMLPNKGCRKITMACFGNAGHYMKPSGLCVHVKAVVANLKSNWYRRRSYYLPFGDGTLTESRILLGGRKEYRDA